MSGGQAFGTWQHYRQQAINDELLYIYGYGDGGGGPTEEMLEAARARRAAGLPAHQAGANRSVLQQLYERAWDDPRLPTWAGELYLEYHRGTYTSQSRTKQANRAAELLLSRGRVAERLGRHARGRNQQSQLDAAWQILLLQQFHDILPGSSISQVYIDSNIDYRRGPADRATRCARRRAEHIVSKNREPRR